MIKARALDTRGISMLVLDEADEMDARGHRDEFTDRIDYNMTLNNLQHSKMLCMEAGPRLPRSVRRRIAAP